MKKFTKSSLKSGNLWEDDEPWKIEDLLKLDVKKDG